ncbi:hypothetical protein ACI797_07875 [Geodermatophilus sp. SYSU D00691]
MPVGIVTDVPAPVEMYDALHAELLRRYPGPVEGLLLHVARPTAAGFQVVEVWESREVFDRYNAEVVFPLMAELSGGAPMPDAPAPEEFEVRGLVIQGAGVRV